MRFLDQKEEVIDIQITPTGTRLLQLGGFNPAYYCFFDDDVIYDSKWAGVTGESQNDIETRIQDVPRLQAMRAKYSVEDKIHNDVGAFAATAEYDLFQSWEYLSYLGVSQVFADSGYFSDMLGLKLNSNGVGYSSLIQDPRNRMYGFYGTIANMGYESGDEMPYWGIKFLKAPLTASAMVSSGSSSSEFAGGSVYKLYTDLQYKLSIEKTTSPSDVDSMWDDLDPLNTAPNEKVGTSLEDLNMSPISLDGTFIQVIDDYLFLKVEEENTRYIKENFEIEVYQINNDDPQSGNFSNEKRLFFDNPDIALSDVLSGDNPQPYTDTKGMEWQSSEDSYGTAQEAYTQSYVEYYFDVLVDEQIPDEIFCKAMKEDTTTFNFLDKQMFSCKDIEDASDMDPYDLPDNPTEICD